MQFAVSLSACNNKLKQLSKKIKKKQSTIGGILSGGILSFDQWNFVP